MKIELPTKEFGNSHQNPGNFYQIPGNFYQIPGNFYQMVSDQTICPDKIFGRSVILQKYTIHIKNRLEKLSRFIDFILGYRIGTVLVNEAGNQKENQLEYFHPLIE